MSKTKTELRFADLKPGRLYYAKWADGTTRVVLRGGRSSLYDFKRSSHVPEEKYRDMVFAGPLAKQPAQWPPLK